MLTVLAILGVLVALFLAAALATRDDQALRPVAREAADLALPVDDLRADDVRGLRFGLAVRGYRMSEVDEALDRLAAELDAHERRIAELTGEPLAQEAAPVSLAKRSSPVVEAVRAPEPVAQVRTVASPAPVAAAAPLVALDLPSGPPASPREPADDGFPEVQPADDLSVDEAPVDPPARP